MTELFRSEEMQLVQLFIQSEAAHDAVEELGQEGVMQFKDLNPDLNSFQRRFVNEVKRCDEMERKLRFFTEQVNKAKIVPGEEAGVADVTPTDLTLDNMEIKFEELEKEVKQMNTHQGQLLRRYNELVELHHCLDKAAVFFEETTTKAPVLSVTPGATEETTEGNPTASASLLDHEESPGIGAHGTTLGFVIGVIPRNKIAVFERILWRATRGNLYMKHSEIDEPIQDPQTEEDIEKNVFIIFYQGERVRTKITKHCEAYGANLYQCPESPNERNALADEVQQQLLDTKAVIDNTLRHRRTTMVNIFAQLPAWTEKVKREKAIYHVMNLFNFDVTNKVFIAEGWVPKSQVETVQRVHLRRATDRSGALVPSILRVIETNEVHPTYHKVNKFMKPYQALVDGFGVSRYREVNPGIFTCATFPFLFGVMFGDFGHGFILFLYALYLVRNEREIAKKKVGEITAIFFGGRYVILLMGMMSMYCGLLYNEIFALPNGFFGTAWTFDKDGNGILTDQRCWFGMDSAWNGSTNELTFSNSLKMKSSIVLGVMQMVLGVFIAFANAVHFKSKSDIWFDFVPRLLFLTCIFGYLAIVIVVKWCIPFNDADDPSLMNVLMEMLMSPGSSTNYLYPGQGGVQFVLFFVSMACIPVLFLGKPIVKYITYKKDVKLALMRGDEKPEFIFSEVMLGQFIHAVEYLIGCISNTASYLRLWALSLAHSMLSKVLYEQLFMMTVEMNNFVVIFGGFAAFATMTMAVLCMMEALSCFLHALRLHWVEFQNKFYYGDGIKFAPFEF